MRARFITIFGLVTLILGAFACRGVQAGGGDGKDPYVVRPTLAKSSDGTGHATVAVQVARGWHWNAEYPFKLTVQEQQGTTLAKTAFTPADVKVASDGTSATVDLGPTGSLADGARMKGVINFGVCEAKVCRFCRNCAVEWTVGGGTP